MEEIGILEDVIIGAVTNYGIDQLKPYVLSLKQSGFKGTKLMVCYNIRFDTAQFLQENGFKLCVFEKNDQHQQFYFAGYPQFNICVDRFYHMWQFLNQELQQNPDKKYRYLFSFDTGDVIFQSNPSIALENMNLENTNKKIVATTESLYYRDESLWGRQNMISSFGMPVYDHMKDRLIYNAGSLAGNFMTIKDMMLTIFEMCQGYKTPNPDQAAYNLLLSLEPYKSLVHTVMSEDGFACELGTTYDPAKMGAFKHLLVEPSPIYDEANNQFITNQTKKPYAIVHQYNRMHDIFAKLVNRYK